MKSFPVSSETHSATFTSNPAGAFSPVPTAVPPSASCFRYGSDDLSISASRSSDVRHPDISWLNEIGTASWRCVLPDFTIPSFSFSSLLNVSTSTDTAGRSLSSISHTAEICSAVGNVSFDDWLMFMSSFGWQSFFPAISFARFAITSFAFMLLCVPLPVCHTTSGKCPFSAPLITSSQACSIAASFSSVILSGFRAWFALAAAFFR